MKKENSKTIEYEQFETRLFIITLAAFITGFGLGTLLIWFRNYKKTDTSQEVETDG